MGDSVDDSGTGTDTDTDTDTDTTAETEAGTAGGSDDSGSGGSSSGTDTDDMPGTDDGGLVCTSEYDPVCGVDGETYDHPCSAIAAGVEIRRDGPCFGDCEGSCSVGGSPMTLAFAVVVGVVFLRPRRRSRRRR